MPANEADPLHRFKCTRHRTLGAAYILKYTAHENKASYVAALVECVVRDSRRNTCSFPRGLDIAARLGTSPDSRAPVYRVSWCVFRRLARPLDSFDEKERAERMTGKVFRGHARCGLLWVQSNRWFASRNTGMKIRDALRIRYIDDYVVDYAHYLSFPVLCALLAPHFTRLTQLKLLGNHRYGPSLRNLGKSATNGQMSSALPYRSAVVLKSLRGYPGMLVTETKVRIRALTRLDFRLCLRSRWSIRISANITKRIHSTQ